MGGLKGMPSWGYVLGKPFNELLNWPTDCKAYSTVGWPGKGPLTAKSSAALNKYHLKSNMSIKYKYTEIHNLIDTHTRETMSNTSDNHETTWNDAIF